MNSGVGGLRFARDAIKPGRSCGEIEEEAAERMRARLGEFDFATSAHSVTVCGRCAIVSLVRDRQVDEFCGD